MREECSTRGWEHTESPLVWRELVLRGGRGVYVGGAKEFEQYAAHYHGITPHTSSSLEEDIGEQCWTHVCMHTLHTVPLIPQPGRTCRLWRASSWRRSLGRNLAHSKSQSRQLPPPSPTTCFSGQPGKHTFPPSLLPPLNTNLSSASLQPGYRRCVWRGTDLTSSAGQCIQTGGAQRGCHGDH